MDIQLNHEVIPLDGILDEKYKISAVPKDETAFLYYDEETNYEEGSINERHK